MKLIIKISVFTLATFLALQTAYAKKGKIKSDSESEIEITNSPSQTAKLSSKLLTTPFTKPVKPVKKPAQLSQAAEKRNQISFASQALRAAKKDKFQTAKKLAAKSKDPDLQKLISWMFFADPKNADKIKFDQITAFIRRNPHWPDIDILQNSAEKSLNDNIPETEIIKWFADKKPETRQGMEKLAVALLSYYKNDDDMQEIVKNLIKETWVEGNFTKKEEKDFYRKYKKFLTEKDHIARMERLTQDHRINAAYRIMHLVDSDHKKLFQARARLIRNSRSALNYFVKIPENFRGDEGLAYDLARWHHKRNHKQEVKEILLNLPVNLKNPESWWRLRAIYVRELIKERDFNAAYKIISQHQLISGGKYADAEWLSGWVALRFLKDPELAYRHFYTLYHNVNMPISLARAAYWAGRATEATGNQASMSKLWYSTAAKHYTTFYGQLASLKLGSKEIALQSASYINSNSNRSGKNVVLGKKTVELVELSELLIDENQPSLAKKFLKAAVASATNADEVRKVYQIVNQTVKGSKNPEYLVLVSRNSIKQGFLPHMDGYPLLEQGTLKKIRNAAAEAELVHAIIRQESMFDTDARSSAGALGLMQLMPATARQVSKKMRLYYSKGRLTASPAYNVQLGTRLIGDLIDKYEGSYVLAIAAYNAGPGNVKKWVNELGDPRKIKSVEKMVDWIEMIPFSETRNYVQRVTEGLQVYRHVIAANQLKARRDEPVFAMNFLGKDLVR